VRGAIVYNDRGRGRISIPYILTIAVALLLVAALAARQMTRAYSTRVVVARDSIASGDRIDASKLTFADVAKGAVPAGALLDPAVIIGHVVQRPVAKGQAITATDFAAAITPMKWLSDAPPEGRVVVTVSVPGTLLPVQQLRLGDQFELLGVSREGQSRVVGRDAYYLGAIKASRREPAHGPLDSLVQSTQAPRPTGVVGLVLAVRPEDVSPIAQAEAKGETIALALHGSREIVSGHLLQISPPREHASVAAAPNQVELITGAHREKVDLH
jgi:Flp pilus assembly protein CpaB